jgi:predicted RNase H-like HicB family nuclease
MIIEWSDADDAFVVTVPDLPGCRTHGTTREEAAGRGEEAIAAMIGSYAEDDLEPPKPHFSAMHRDAATT